MRVSTCACICSHALYVCVLCMFTCRHTHTHTCFPSCNHLSNASASHQRYFPTQLFPQQVPDKAIQKLLQIFPQHHSHSPPLRGLPQCPPPPLKTPSISPSTSARVLTLSVLINRLLSSLSGCVQGRGQSCLNQLEPPSLTDALLVELCIVCVCAHAFMCVFSP